MWRRWFQLRLASLMLLITLSAVGIDYFRRRSRLLKYADLHAAEAKCHWHMARSAGAQPITFQALTRKGGQCGHNAACGFAFFPAERKRGRCLGPRSRHGCSHYRGNPVEQSNDRAHHRHKWPPFHRYLCSGRCGNRD